MSAAHIIIVEKRTDLCWPDPDSLVITAEEFVSEHSDVRSRPRKVINRYRSYDCLSMGYYCSLLAEARGDRVTPSVETIVALRGEIAESTRLAGLTRLVGRLNEVPRSVIILAQEFMYTEFDWRVGVLAGEPLFVARYFMAHGNWQILKHTPDGKHAEGRTEAIAIKDTPRKVLDAALHAAQLAGIYVIEINDNPNIDIGMEDAVLGDELYRRLLGRLLSKFESLRGGPRPNARTA